MSSDLKQDAVKGPPLAPAGRLGPGGLPEPLGRFCVLAAVLALVFCMPLWNLARLSFKSEMYSHVLLIPLITGYLIWIDRQSVPFGSARPSRWAWIPFLLGGATLAAYWILAARGWQPTRINHLSITIFSFVCFIVGAGFLVLGDRVMKAVAFPFGFLIFMVPFPSVVEYAIEVFFQYTSAEAANVMLHLSYTPVVRDGLIFQLPGITIQVAKECSGIRSSLVLFITSLLAGHLFLRSPWRRTILTLAVIPLGIVRNGFRIWSIAMLCVHVDPGMIESFVHRKGGPIFFLLSLVPFFLFMLYLRKSEVTAAQASAPGRKIEDAGKMS